MKISIKTLSYTITGSGEGSALIDVDVVFDDWGIPYIPSRRVKGILRESALEVLEVLGANTQIVDAIFGKQGFQEGKLRIGNLYIPDYMEIKKEIENLIGDKDFGCLVSKSKIINYFTTLRQQTAIDKNGIAQEHTMRTLRVLKPDLEFQGEMTEIKPLSNREKALLYLASLNFRRIGTARNRGFGEVECRIEDLGIDDVCEAIGILKKNDNHLSTEGQEEASFKYSIENIKKRLPVIIETLSPVLIAKQVGDQNVVNTQRYIPATTIRGILANEFMRRLNLTDAHENDDFYRIFLKSELSITPAYPVDEGDEVYFPAPLFIHKEAGREEGKVYNILEGEPEFKTEYIGGFLRFMDDEKVYKTNPKTYLYFHSARDRISGRSTEEEGSIFYYEALSEGQKFRGYIVGDKGVLEGLKNLFGNTFTAFLGRSKTAQYGEVKISFGAVEDIEDDEFEEDTEFILWLLSPLILYNEFGMPEASEKTLKEYLEKSLGCTVEIEKSVAKTDWIETFVGVWRMKTPSEIAFAPGSSFKVKVDNSENLEEKLKKLEIYGLGERREQGFGRVKVLMYLKESYVMDEHKKEKAEFQPGKSCEILRSILKSDLIKFFEYKGFETAKGFLHKDKISNHLIGRLEMMVKNSENLEDFKNKLNGIEEKQAGENLKDVGLWFKLKKFDVYEDVKKDSDYQIRFGEQIYKKLNFNIDDLGFELLKTYWISFFRNLRMLKKLEEKK